MQNNNLDSALNKAIQTVGFLEECTAGEMKMAKIKEFSEDEANKLNEEYDKLLQKANDAIKDLEDFKKNYLDKKSE